MNDKEHTAYHEAGHVIACDELGVQHGGLSILSKMDGSAGRTLVEGGDFFSLPGDASSSPEDEAAFRDWAEKQAVIDYAGHAAVVELLGIGDMSDRSAARNGAGADFEKARERLGGDPERMQSGRDLAIAIVAARSKDLRRLAKAVLSHGCLDSQIVDCVLYDSPFNRAVMREALAARRVK